MLPGSIKKFHHIAIYLRFVRQPDRRMIFPGADILYPEKQKSGQILRALLQRYTPA
jgi:hypothetical protein